MKKLLVLIVLLLSAHVLVFSQNGNVQNAAIPKDAAVDVTVSDFKNNLLNNEIIVFKSKINNKEFQGITNETGKFTVRLPAGDEYEIFILGFKDSTSYNVLKIPATTGNAYYKKPFVVNIQFQPSKTFVLEDCNFDFGKATLQESSFTVLDELVAYLNRKDDERIEIGGHTDNVGKPASNLKLSLDRANAVRDYLIGKGINPERLTAKGYGMTEPIAENNTEEGRAQNRRTEVKIL
jgi:outer membrane protein OmpA-like peptidoglycan-associated protein